MKGHVIVLIISSCLLSCSSDDDSELVANPSFEQSDFPVSVGNYWEYKVTNEENSEIDTLLIEVLSEIDTAGVPKYLCSLSLSGVAVDSSYISINSNNLVYKAFNAETTYFADFILEFPFDEGDIWNGFTQSDSILVVSKTESFVIDGTTFSPVYELQRNLSGFGYSLSQTFKVSPKIGLINQRIVEFTGSSLEKRHFELIDYHLH